MYNCREEYEPLAQREGELAASHEARIKRTFTFSKLPPPDTPYFTDKALRSVSFLLVHQPHKAMHLRCTPFHLTPSFAGPAILYMSLSAAMYNDNPFCDIGTCQIKHVSSHDSPEQMALRPC